MDSLKEYLWSAVSNRAQGMSTVFIKGDSTPWVSTPGKWARCYNVNKHTPAYRAWDGIRVRVSKSSLCKNPSYLDKSCCESWHNYQEMAEWFYSQRGDFEGWTLDKDTLKPLNKMYEPSACGLVPMWLNKFYAFSYKTNSSGFPGVSISKQKNLWQVRSQSIVLDPQPARFFESFGDACESYCSLKENMAKLLMPVAERWGVDEKYIEALGTFKVKNYIIGEIA